ncbi:cytochrome P450 11C1 [Chanos chanos]|uniref:steroid 11beta-monooxygenase n=1 Tax=Chanos chanos TaxID=29144 RepID=A0A6J2WAR1_CHACN|nr:cytochrome P450 11B, mitochondrial-like [Chanos chanos]
MDKVVKKSLAKPFKKLTSCVSGGKDRDIWSRHRSKRGRGCKGRSGAPRPNHAHDPALVRSYQADLERERKLREAMNARKNAERAAMRAHFRQKYQLSKNSKDANHLRAVGGKVSLPRELAKIVRPEGSRKDDSFNLLSAFQGLSFNMGVFTGTKPAKKTPTPTPAGGESCKALEAADGGMERKKARRNQGGSGGARAFEEIPHTGSNGWINLLRFWKEDKFRHLHKHMQKTFNTLGPIYREYLGSQSTVNILLPADIGELFRSEGLHPRRMTLQPWATHRETRQHSKGVFLKNGAEWRADRLLLNREVMTSAAVKHFLPLLNDVARDFCHLLRSRVQTDGTGAEGRRSLTLDPSPDLFRFALEASCHVLYGERIGLFSSTPSQESERFIWAVERMLATTQPLLYLPTHLLLRLHAPMWTQHATAWDHIFSHAEARIQRGYQRLQAQSGGLAGGSEGQFSGVLGNLMEKGQLSLELIKANITELMAGGVDTTAVPLQFALFELARNPEVQETVRAQVQSSWIQADGNPQKALQGAPLLKGTVKETLRLYPVGITVQRYPIKDIVLQNYHIPAGTLVQACLYPLGRSGDVFQDPERFEPARWGRDGEEQGVTSGAGSGAAFRSLAFGFGARQCVGRRIAENEMQLFLMHILRNFHLSVSSTEDLRTTYTLILQPETPPKITFTTL